MATPETFTAIVRDLIGELLRAEGINPALHRVLIEQVLRTSARREMLGFEERLEAVLAEGMRAAKIELADPDLVGVHARARRALGGAERGRGPAEVQDAGAGRRADASSWWATCRGRGRLAFVKRCGRLSASLSGVV